MRDINDNYTIQIYKESQNQNQNQSKKLMVSHVTVFYHYKIYTMQVLRTESTMANVTD